MSSFVFACLLLASPFQDTAVKPEAKPAAPAQTAPVIAPETKAALTAACAKLSNAKSYVFDLTAESTGFGGGGRGGDGGGGAGGPGGGGPRPPQTTHAEFQTGVPMHVKQGETEAYVHDGKIVRKNADGAWELMERGGRGPGGPGGPGGQGGGGKGGDGAGAPKAGGAEGGAAGAGAGGATPPKAGEGAGAGGAAGAGGPPQGGPGGGRGGRGGMGSMMGLASLQLPGTLVKDLDGKVAEATMETKDGKTTIKGKLTDAAALALTSFGGRRRDGDDAGPERKATGTFELVVLADGSVESLILDTQMSMDLEDRHIDMKRKSTYAISKIDAVELKVPDEVLSHFAS